ncbi:MAG: hypothetical protein EPN40_12855 [Rhodanobacteraceae bacterium]|nr:MAG: hypothetical protein EPN40_12855 [Rhodanobacteraceae bacterium]
MIEAITHETDRAEIVTAMLEHAHAVSELLALTPDELREVARRQPENMQNMANQAKGWARELVNAAISSKRIAERIETALLPDKSAN